MCQIMAELKSFVHFQINFEFFDSDPIYINDYQTNF